MFVPKFSFAYLIPCWKPQLNFCGAGISIPPINPSSPSFNSREAATPTKNPACSSAKNIETVLSATSYSPLPL